MEKLKIVIKKYWKIYLAALVISAVCDLIGTVKLNIGVGFCEHAKKRWEAIAFFTISRKVFSHCIIFL